MPNDFPPLPAAVPRISRRRNMVCTRRPDRPRPHRVSEAMSVEQFHPHCAPPPHHPTLRIFQFDRRSTPPRAPLTRARVVEPPHVPRGPLVRFVLVVLVNPQLDPLGVAGLLAQPLMIEKAKVQRDPLGVGGVVAPLLMIEKAIVQRKRFTSRPRHCYMTRPYGQHCLNQMVAGRCVLNAGAVQGGY